MLCRHRYAVGRMQSGAPHPRAGHHADLRVRHHRYQAHDPAAVDRRRGAVRNRPYYGVGAGNVPLLAPGGRITVGFLGGAQIDRYANLNTTVVGPYDKPKVRLPGGGGAPEIAISCGEIFIIMAHGKRGFVEKLDFVTSLGHGEGGDHRARLGIKTKGPTRLITDLAVFEPDRLTKEMTVVSIHAGVTRDDIDRNTGWEVKYAAEPAATPTPTAEELAILRELHARTKRAH